MISDELNPNCWVFQFILLNIDDIDRLVQGNAASGHLPAQFLSRTIVYI